jgi:hypothetical protein
MLSPLPLIPRVLAVVLTTLTTLVHGAPSRFPFTNSDISVAPPTHRGLVLALAASELLAPSRADEQRQPHLPCVTIHVYDPAAQFHAYCLHCHVNQAHPEFVSDQPPLVYGDSATEAALLSFRLRR